MDNDLDTEGVEILRDLFPEEFFGDVEGELHFALFSDDKPLYGPILTDM